jgi:prolipoprotein diacylglyceryl transferase
MSYILWEGNPVLFEIGRFTLRWNALLLLLIYLVCRQILLHIYRKEEKSSGKIDILSAYLVLGALLGARLGHILLYQQALIWNNPLSIFLPFEFGREFHFTGMKGFSVHGAAAGILLALWFFKRRNDHGQSYLQLSDRIAILASIAGVFFLVGSFLNSETNGTSTRSATGTVFISPIKKGLLKLPCCIMRNPEGKNPLSLVVVNKGKEQIKNNTPNKPVIIYLFFSPGATEQLVNEFLMGDVKTYLYENAAVIHEPGTEPLHYNIFLEKDGSYIARIRTTGIARYPVQLYEALTCLLLFIFLFWLWNKRRANAAAGMLTAYFMITFWGLELLYGYIKENHAPFINGLDLSVQQLLCIPFILFGAGIILWRRKKV